MSLSLVRRLSVKLACGVVCAALVGLAGCEGPSETDVTAKPQIDRSPKAKFDRIVAELRDLLQGNGVTRETIRDNAGSGTATSSYDIQVQKGVDENPEPGKPLMVTIAITHKASYSSMRNEVPDEEEPSDEQPTVPADTAENLGEAGYEVLDPSRMAEDFARATKPGMTVPGSVAGAIESRNEVIYDLIYENNRWRMAVPPSVDSLQSTNEAMKIALERQG